MRAVPGVEQAMVALTAERRPAQARRAARRAGRRRRAARAAWRGPPPKAGVPGVERHHRRRLRQGRRRQIHRRGQSRARPAGARPQGRHPRRRHLRPVDAAAARPSRPPGVARRAHAEAAGALRAEGHVDRLPRRGGDADDLARADGAVGARRRCCARSPGASSTCSSSTCRPAPATRSSPWRSRCRSPARSSSRRRRTWR